MKKIMFAAAMIAATAALADVTSANVVGYTTISLGDTSEKAIYYMAGCQFKDVGGATDVAKVTDLVKLSGVTPGTYRTADTAAPQIQVWNASTQGYTKYFYISDANLTAGGKGTAWATGRNEATGTIDLGNAFWLILPKGSTSAGATATFAGEVKSDAKTKSFSVGDASGDAKFAMFLNPFPTDLTFAMLTTEGLTPGTYRTADTAAPQMQVWNAATQGYTKYFYISDANLTAGGKGTAWATGRNQATGTIAAPGVGFWVKSATQGTITVTLP